MSMRAVVITADGTWARAVRWDTQAVVTRAAEEGILEAEVSAFEGVYTDAHVATTYTGEADAIEALLKDSVRLVVVTRKLSADEMSVFAAQKITPRQLDIAIDAVAVIVNRNNPDSLLKVDHLRGILGGRIKRWNEINKKSKPVDIKVVFDHPNSGIIRFLKDSVENFDKLPPNCFAAHGNDSVVSYVADSPVQSV